VGLYDWTIFLRWLVVPKGRSILLASWLAGSTRLGDVLTFRAQRLAFSQSSVQSTRGSSMNHPGSVSVGVWQMACRRVIKVGERAVKNMIGELSLLISNGLIHTSVAQRLRNPLPSQQRWKPAFLLVRRARDMDVATEPRNSVPAFCVLVSFKIICRLCAVAGRVLFQ
jgi:hypothetical protein